MTIRKVTGLNVHFTLKFEDPKMIFDELEMSLMYPKHTERCQMLSLLK